ncbi:transcriptional regulator [Sporosarcina sp. P37]|uniref:winged helix-turn-helix transcriptional regulator n=1 Tax=unclassified Sporosarcina TaxID=2647733 RepID=UPI0009C0C90C|nr:MULTISPECIES: helix-turn-helix domain-containing protein [unclassified Sporosarcina]ARD49709.1 HxlR family transcriptional regulator [Sporosarcina sp. P33]ARK26272.1 transcriptional regulator [Sporosarcina sp. P37]PID18209.1 transcriptional regulator [Sporosarcina sp. P35]
MKVCPYLESSFEILGRRWNGLIIHYLSNCPDYTAHFSQMKRDLHDITPRSLSLKLTELAECNLVVKNVMAGTPVTITYQLTEKGQQLAIALQPIQAWAQQYIELESSDTKK